MVTETTKARRTPAARALVGCLALRDGATTNQAFKLAGYELRKGANVNGTSRAVMRNGRIVTVTRAAHVASFWLLKLGRKLEALGVGKAAA